MTTVEALKALKKFLEDKVASTILLQKESLITTEEPEDVNPYVALMTLPHKNFTPTTFQVPHILVGFTNGDDAGDEHSIYIRLQFATFGGTITDERTNIPDSSGYIDLLNLIERTKEKLISATVIKNAGVVEKPISYGVYDEQITYPYWYGYMTFKLQTQITNPQFNNIL